MHFLEEAAGFGRRGIFRRRRPRPRALGLSGLLDSLWQFRVAQLLCIEINDRKRYAMLDLDLTKVVQIWVPFRVLAEIFRNPLREQDVPRIPARHDPLRDVDGSAGNVGPVVHVRSTANGPAVHPHPQFQPRVAG